MDNVLDHLDDQKECVRDVKKALQKQGETLAAINERTKQHEKRMDRMDKKSAGLGAATGALGGFLAVLVRSLFGPPGP